MSTHRTTILPKIEEAKQVNNKNIINSYRKETDFEKY